MESTWLKEIDDSRRRITRSDLRRLQREPTNSRYFSEMIVPEDVEEPWKNRVDFIFGRIRILSSFFLPRSNGIFLARSRKKGNEEGSDA